MVDDLFYVADIDKSNSLNSDEYLSFVKAFVEPFLKCAKKWALRTEEDLACVLKDKWAKNLF
jgi:hypothetical protein